MPSKKTNATTAKTARNRRPPLTALATHRPIFSPAEAARLAHRLYGLDGEATALHGERNENFLIRGVKKRALVLKIAGAQEDLDGIAMHIAALEHVARTDPGLPVPRVVPTHDGHASVVLGGKGKGAGQLVYAVSLLPGRPLGDDQLPPAFLFDLGALVARLDRALRGFHHPWAPTRLAWDPRSAPILRTFVRLIEPRETRLAVEAVYRRFLGEVLPQFAALRGQFIHNDAQPANLLVKASYPTRLAGIVDFGDMVHAPLMVGLAAAAAEMARPDMDLLDVAAEVVRGYSSVVPLEDDEISLLHDAMQLRYATTLTVSAWRRHHDAKGVPLLAGYELICRAAMKKLSGIGREVTTATLRRAASRAIVIPSLKPRQVAASDADIEPLLIRRRRLLGPDLALTYRRPLHIVRGSGVWLHDAAGNAYLDAYNNVPQVGHAHPYVVEAIARQAATLATNTRYLHETVLDYAEKLTRTMPKGLDVCVFVNSGSEANDVAWRIAKAWTRNPGAIVMENAYHGMTDAIAALSPYEVPAERLAAHVRVLEAPDTYRGRFGPDSPDAGARYAADAERAVASLAAAGMRPAALMVDTGFTSNGILDVPKFYLAAIAATVRAAGGVLVADEVQNGFARSGKNFWGFEGHGVVPDLVVMGKPVGNGYPLGVIVTRAEILRAFTSGTDYFSTFGGNPVSAAAGLAVIEVIEREKLQANARTTGAHLRRGLETLKARHPAVGDVRGSGLLIGVEIVRDRKTRAPDREATDFLKNRMRDFGVLVGSEGVRGNILKIRPPLPIRPDEADLIVEALRRALAED